MKPTGTEARICELIAQRQQMGIAKYGTTVEDNPLGLVQWLKHLRDEMLDGAVYVQRAIEQLEGVEEGDSDYNIHLTDEQRLKLSDPMEWFKRYCSINPNNLQQNEPHAELRKTWAPGQKWRFSPDGYTWYEVEGEPTWARDNLYMREDDPHAELKKTWKPGQRWQQAGHDGVWHPCQSHNGVPLWAPWIQYRRHPDDKDPQEAEKPWYPDDSGEWVEVPDDCMECPVREIDLVSILIRGERDRREYEEEICIAGNICWSFEAESPARVVAYKISSRCRMASAIAKQLP